MILESDSIQSSSQRSGPEITKARATERRAEARDAARVAEQNAVNQRREAAKTDPTRGQNIDTFA